MFVYIVSISHYTFILSVVHPENARKQNGGESGAAALLKLWKYFRIAVTIIP
jgi:hypothetical protein